MKYPMGLMKIEKIKPGESIMRGRDSNDNPFIAMHVYYKKDFHLFGHKNEGSKIIVFHQSTFDTRWNILEIVPRHIYQQNVSIEGDKIRGNLIRKDMYPFLKDLMNGKAATLMDGLGHDAIYKLTKQE